MGHFQPTSASAGCSGFWLFSAWPSSPWASLKLKPRQLPIQRLILIFFMEDTVLDIIMEAIMATLTTATTARDLLKLSLLLLLTPRLKLTPGMDTTVDMVSDTMVDTTVDTMATPTMDTLARGLLMPRLPLLLQLTPRLIPGWCMDTTVLVATTATVATTVATLTTAITARDLLTLSLLLPLLLMPRLIPGMDTTVDTTTVATHTMAMAMVTAMATTGASKKGVIKCRADGHEVPTVFDDDLPNVLNFREESKRTKQNILLLQTHCI